MKHKHNKNKNTAFLYNILIQELAKSHLEKNEKKAKNIRELFRKHFAQDSLLRKELVLFNHLSEAICDSENIAEQIISEAKRQYTLLSQNELNKKRQELFFKMKKIIPSEGFNHFIPNYRTMASIFQIFNGTSPKNQIILENEIKRNMIKPLEEKLQLDEIDNITIKEFIKIFNNEYDSLLEEQKDLLKTYITSFMDNGIDLKLKINEQIKSIKNKLSAVKEDDEVIKENIQKVSKELDSFSKKEISEEIILKILKAHNIVKEIAIV